MEFSLIGAEVTPAVLDTFLKNQRVCCVGDRQGGGGLGKLGEFLEEAEGGMWMLAVSSSHALSQVWQAHSELGAGCG